MRILIGTTEIAGTINDYADGFRALGHDVTTCILDRNPLYPDARYDVDISVQNWFSSLPPSLAKSHNLLIRLPRGAMIRGLQLSRLIKLIAKHELFVFLWAGTSLTRNCIEFPYIKLLGKKIVSIFLGSDVREVTSFAREYNRADSYVSPEFIATLSARANISTSSLVQRIRHAELHSDLIYSQPNQSNLAIRPYMHLYLPIDLSKYVCHIPKREIPVVVHAPSSTSIKGTDEILTALRQLEVEGVRFELIQLNRVPNKEVLAQLTNADVVIDQLYSGGYGKLSMESMASGSAVATRRFDVFWPDNSSLPIHHIDSKNISQQLKLLLTNRELRIRLAESARSFITQRHTAQNIAQSILDALATCDQSQFQYDYYPRFFFDNFNVKDFPTCKAATTRIVRRWGLPADLANKSTIVENLFGANNHEHPLPMWPQSAQSVTE